MDLRFRGNLNLNTGYGSFRSGIDYLVKDAKKFNEIVVSNLVGTLDIPKHEFYRIERRLGVPGKIQRLLVRIERLSNITEELERVKSEIINILKKLPDEEDRKMFIKALPEPISPTLPQSLSSPVERQPVVVVNQPHDEALRKKRKILKAKKRKKLPVFLIH